MPKLLRTSALILSVCAAASARAQSGPWRDGEILVRNLPASGPQAILRIDPLTGHGETLISGFYYAGWAGGMAFDSYRDAVLLCASLPPAGYSIFKLWSIASDGTATVVPGLDQVPLRAITPVGDGRVFFQRHLPGTQQPIEYLDAGNNLQVLLDPSGSVPFVFDVEHMRYHPPTNSLIATTSGWWSLNDCSSTGCSIFRIPLSSDGSRVGGPVSCASIATSNEEIMALDFLPSGEVVLTIASGAAYPASHRLRSIDPLSLADSPWADPSLRDLNGGIFSSLLGKMVVLDDWSDELRTYAHGGTQDGSLLPIDVSLANGSSGYSPVESLYQIDLRGTGACTPPTTYCTAKAGSHGCTPAIGFSGTPTASGASSFAITCSQVLNQQNGRLFYGYLANSAPFQGGWLCVKAPLERTALQNSGGSASPASDCSGSYSYDFEARIQSGQDPALTAGANVFAQYWFRDPQDPAGFGTGLSNALRLQICP